MRMKFIWQLKFTALCLLLASCSNPEISTNDTTTNIMAGTLTEYTADTVDSLKCFSINSDLLGKCAVSSDGKFSITLLTPTGTKIGKLDNVAVSDTNAIVSFPTFTKGYKKNKHTGTVYNVNKTTLADFGTNTVIMLFYYCDRDLRIKGTRIISTSNSSETLTYDLILNKGWNVISYKIIEQQETETYSTQSIFLSNTIQSGLSWRLFII